MCKRVLYHVDGDFEVDGNSLLILLLPGSMWDCVRVCVCV